MNVTSTSCFRSPSYFLHVCRTNSRKHHDIIPPFNTKTRQCILTQHSVILVTKWATGGGYQVANLNGSQLEISPIRLDGIQSDVWRRGYVQCSSRPRQRRGNLGISNLPGRVDKVDHGMQRIPDWVLWRHMDAIHLAADLEVGAGMDSQAAAANDSVELELEVAGTRRVHSCDQFGPICVCLGNVRVEVAYETARA